MTDNSLFEGDFKKAFASGVLCPVTCLLSEPISHLFQTPFQIFHMVRNSLIFIYMGSAFHTMIIKFLKGQEWSGSATKSRTRMSPNFIRSSGRGMLFLETNPNVPRTQENESVNIP
jgi:hypothetical protein